VFLVVALAAAVGCGYQLAGRSSGRGSFIPPDVRTIGIPPLENETDRPEIDQRLTEQLIEEFQRRGSYETVPGAAGADAVLEGTIVSFRSEPVTFTERGRFDRVEVVVTASMRLVRSSPETILWSQNYFTFREQYDVPETPLTEFDREIIAIEEIADGFARSVVTSILEGF
jgi:TolB-like protein